MLGWSHIWMDTVQQSWRRLHGSGCNMGGSWRSSFRLLLGVSSLLPACAALAIHPSIHTHTYIHRTDQDTTEHDFLPHIHLIIFSHCGCDIAYVLGYPLQLARWSAAAAHPTPTLNSALILMLPLPGDKTTPVLFQLNFIPTIVLGWCRCSS